VEEEGISAEDFAKSLLICLPLNHVGTYLKRIHSLPELSTKFVTFEQFVAFTFFIDDVDSIKEKVLAFRYVTEHQIKDLAKEFTETNEYCIKNKVKISDV